LLRQIVRRDRELTMVLITATLHTFKKLGALLSLLQRFLFLGPVRAFDPNDTSTRKQSAKGGVFLIPTGIGGTGFTDEQGDSTKGRRIGVREFILQTQAKFPNRLVLAQGIHVKRVLFEESTDETRSPRAIGVVGVQGRHLYKASPLHQAVSSPDIEFYVRPANSESSAGEVVLSGGSFNTPQLLQLSGIGDRDQLASVGIRTRVHLPGVGRNLQDRYEVALMSELRHDVEALDTVSFTPGDPNDRARDQWILEKDGIYSVNGGTIAILHRSAVADGDEPDLFTFGTPAAFRGYYWNWSKEIFRPTKGTGNDQRNLWSWIILKAYTRNNGGVVQLRSNDPFDTPSICFHSFEEGNAMDWERDVDALSEAISRLREINTAFGSPLDREIQPAAYLARANEERRSAGLPEWTLADWIKNEAWGHHACGTCRIGSDAWQANTANLIDTGAVLDSRFQVHGVSGLRVVDASVFPKIPGYFILAPIFMVSEKAADTLLANPQDETYPEKVRRSELLAISDRRNVAFVDPETNWTKPPALAAAISKEVFENQEPVEGQRDSGVCPRVKNVVGLAFSGGGIRSATFSLGVVQALAERNLLRHIDYVSTVSGGAYLGSFLGRLFTRGRVAKAADPVGRAQDILKDGRSAPIQWLRTQTNDRFASGTDDWSSKVGIYFLNLFSVHLVIGALLIALFGILAGVSHWEPFQELIPQPPGPALWFGWSPSPWWWVPIALLGLVIFPLKLGYWLAPQSLSHRSYPPHALAAWISLVGVAALTLLLPNGISWAGAGFLVIGLAWLFQELARKDLPAANVRGRRLDGLMVRNRLNRALGKMLLIFLLLVAAVVFDTLAGGIARRHYLNAIIIFLIGFAPLLQVLRTQAVKRLPTNRSAILITVKWTCVGLAMALLLLADTIARQLFDNGMSVQAWGVVFFALLFSAALGRAFAFPNRTSMHSEYAARLTRTFLGASNEMNTASADNLAADVSVAHPDDDLPHHLYRPEKQGGPLHLISVCLNQSVDHHSGQEIKNNKGLLMTIGTFGVSVGRRYFAQWSSDIQAPRPLEFQHRAQDLDGLGSVPPVLEAIPLNSDPDTFHPLGRRDGNPAIVQSLSLGEWVAISGAAFGTGRGPSTRPLDSLMVGLLNIRLGYWWDTGIQAVERPGRFPGNALCRLMELPGVLFKTHGLLLSEWLGRFEGPSSEFWNLSDGGFFDGGAIYELVRRRVDVIIAIDGNHDHGYSLNGLAELGRMVRVDFNAEITWLNSVPESLPPDFAEWVNLNEVGSLNELHGQLTGGNANRKHAAIARITYSDQRDRVTWLLLVKNRLAATDSPAVGSGAQSNPEFSQGSTFEQVFDPGRWESYRQLGQEIGRAVLGQ
jgi:hypothetical protein